MLIALNHTNISLWNIKSQNSTFVLRMRNRLLNKRMCFKFSRYLYVHKISRFMAVFADTQMQCGPFLERFSWCEEIRVAGSRRNYAYIERERVRYLAHEDPFHLFFHRWNIDQVQMSLWSWKCVSGKRNSTYLKSLK